MKRLLTFWLVFCLPVTLLAQEAEGPLAGRIVALRGEPSLYRGVKELPAQALGEVFANDSIRCTENQAAKILLEDGSVLIVGPESELRIADVDFAFHRSRRQLELELVSGRAKLVIAPFLSEKSEVILSTPAASIQINDGSFVAEHLGGEEQSRITVLRGQLRLRNLFADDGAAIVLKERYSSEVHASGDPTPPVLVSDEFYVGLLKDLRLSLPELQKPAETLDALISGDLARISGTTIRLNRRPNLPLYGARPSLENVDRVGDRGSRQTPESGDITIHWQFPGGSSRQDNSK